MILGGQTTEFHMYEHLSAHCIIYSPSFGFLIVHLPCKLHPLQMRFVRLIVCLSDREICWKKDSEEFFTLFAAMSQV